MAKAKLQVLDQTPAALGYAFPADEWTALVGQPPECADDLLHDLLAVLER